MQKRNFENYKTRRDAFLAYQQLVENRKTPVWVMGNGDDIPYLAFVIDFNDWIWLPEQKNCAYSVKEYCNQYLGRDYP